MYTPADREALRVTILAAARGDPRLSGGAITGSASVGREDRWSDIDLAFGVGDPRDLPTLLDEWTGRMYALHGARHHMDVRRGGWVYRVFLLESTLQVDLAFAPASEFGARAPTFRLVFGAALEPTAPVAVPAEEQIGYAWLYALHVRSSLARGRLWQAEYMVSAMRDHVLALACRRLGLPAVEGRGLDALPAAVTDPFRATFGPLERDVLRGALATIADRLLFEARAVDPDLAARLGGVLAELVLTAEP